MTRDQLAHILRAATAVTGDPELLVLGSQAILGSLDEHLLPAAATSSIEADTAFLDDPDGAKAREVDNAIGELTVFHQTFGIYAEGVQVAVATLPAGWRDRLVPQWESPLLGRARAKFLDPADLVVAKLVRSAEKDRTFAAALIQTRLVDIEVLAARAKQLPARTDTRAVQRILSYLEHFRRTRLHRSGNAAGPRDED